MAYTPHSHVEVEGCCGIISDVRLCSSAFWCFMSWFVSPVALRKKSLSMASLDPDGVRVDLGDQVLVAGQKKGTIRYYGKTDFAPGKQIKK